VALAETRFLFIYYFFERVGTMKDRYLTPQEVAELLSISYDTALNLIKYSDLEAVQIGRQYRVLESKLNAFLYPPKVAKQPLRQRPIYQIVEERK
jgi:excisionase family DNA binding protein